MAEKASCDFQGKNYPNSGVVCIGYQCIQCHDGKWGANQYELEAREKDLDALMGK